MAKIVAYVAHNAVTNTEEYLENFDCDALATMEEQGLIFIAVYEDGTREIVKAKDISKPEPTVNGIKLATPYYVNVRTAATVAVFDALEKIINPDAQLANETGEEVEVQDPVEAFQSALDALKELETDND